MGWLEYELQNPEMKRSKRKTYLPVWVMTEMIPKTKMI